MTYTLLFVDDDLNLLLTLQNRFELQGYKVETASNVDAALKLFSKSPDEYAGVVADYQIGDETGADLSLKLRETRPELSIIIYSGKGDNSDAVKLSWKAGAVEFLDKSPDLSELSRSIENMCQKYEQTSRLLSMEPASTKNEKLIASIGMVGRSDKMAEIAKRVNLYRTSKKNVLILGETGTGKKLVAEALHEGPESKFFVVNCANYSANPELLRSELFGHTKGSFSGAVADKKGILELANGGTVFLDEIHLLSPKAQGQLLLAVEDHKIQRVGGASHIPVSCRIVAAAKPDIEQMVDDEKFLPDLYERLNVFAIDLPPLRERPEDIEPLLRLACKTFKEETGQEKKFLMNAVGRLCAYHWPRNVRELLNTAERLLFHCQGNRVGQDQLESKFFAKNSDNLLSYPQLKKKQSEELRAFVSLALRRHNHNKDKTARAIKMKPPTLRALMRRLEDRDAG